ncbi:MAG: histidine phosphatase family protein, partial [Victivallales bacterium]|nr:histidine phosphatase family protein [Victivallales bacterium]
TDVSLSQKGLEESIAIGKYLTDINCDHIFASPMLRVKQTLETALAPEKIKDVEYKENLREINFGDWEGKSFEEINEQYPNEVNNWTEPSNKFGFPNGSNLDDFHKGIELFKATLMETSGETIVVFAHGGVILALICSILGLGKDKMLAFKVDRGSISTLELFENGYGILTGLNNK